MVLTEWRARFRHAELLRAKDQLGDDEVQYLDYVS